MSDTTNDVAVRGAQLALEEAVTKVRQSVHPCACEEGHKGDDREGRALVNRVEVHALKIKHAIDYWQKALAHYESLTKEGE